MAHFYGYLTGGRGDVTRTGHKTTGISAQLKTWSAKLNVRLYHVDGEDRYAVDLEGRDGERKELATGTL